MKRALPAALLATIAFTLPALAADPLLSRLAGTWTGRGSYQQSASAKQERIFCKITNTLVENGNALQQRGRCSVASSSGAVDGLITADRRRPLQRLAQQPGHGRSGQPQRIGQRQPADAHHELRRQPDPPAGEIGDHHDAAAATATACAPRAAKAARAGRRPTSPSRSSGSRQSAGFILRMQCSVNGCWSGVGGFAGSGFSSASLHAAPRPGHGGPRGF